MKPIKKYANHILTRADCEDLPVYKDDIMGKTLYQSYWKLSFWERVRVLFLGIVRLSVMANQHPPVFMDTKISDYKLLSE